MQISNISFGTKLSIGESSCAKLSQYNDNVVDGIMVAGEMLNADNLHDEFVINVKKSGEDNNHTFEFVFFDEDQKRVSAKKSAEEFKNMPADKIALMLMNIKNMLKSAISGEDLNLNQVNKKEFKQQKIDRIAQKHLYDDFTCA